MTISNGEKNLTWRYLGGLLVLVVVATIGFLYQDARGDINRKLDKDIYYRDIQRLEGKLDNLLTLQIEHLKERPEVGRGR